MAELHTRLPSPADASAPPPDFIAARAALHKLKGSALTLGASGVGSLCEALRAHCIAGDAAAMHASDSGSSIAALQQSLGQTMGASHPFWFAAASHCPVARRVEHILGAGEKAAGVS